MSSGHVPRVFLETALSARSAITLGKERAHHLSTVLRRKTGDPVCLFNGDGQEFAGRIARLDRKQVDIELGEASRPDRESPLQITLAQGIARGERMDYAIGKAVELGVQVIQPLETRRIKNRLEGPRLEKKIAHWRKVAISAAEQAGRLIVPDIPGPLSLDDYLATQPEGHTGLVLDPDGELGLGAVSAAELITLLIGPEGGLDEAEIAAAVARGYTRIRFGPRVLRTETAGPATLAAVQALWGDLSK